MKKQGVLRPLQGKQDDYVSEELFGSGKLYDGTAKSRKTSTYAIPTVARIQSFMKLNARLKAFIYNSASKTLICEQLSPINYDLKTKGANLFRG